MDVWVRDDIKKWGQMFGVAFQKAGHNVKQYVEAVDVIDTPGMAYILQHHNRAYRTRDKALAQALSAKKYIAMIPSNRENYYYDDKALQFYELWPYMPLTTIVEGPQTARLAMDRLGLPFISKSAQGASAANVDLIETQEQADEQVRQAFGEGIPRRYNLRQKGYLLWQQFLADNPYAYRVTILANTYAFVVKCIAEPGDIFHSSSHIVEVQTSLNDEVLRAIEYCSFIANKHRLSFVGFDVLYDQRTTPKTPKLLEISTGWTIAPGMLGCSIFERTCSNSWAQTAKTITCEQDMFDLLPKAFEQWDYTDDFVWPENKHG